MNGGVRMCEPGFIYVLVNSSLQNMVKIGKTMKDCESRAKELSSATGVPTPFIVAFEVYVNDCSSAEKHLHSLLEEKGYRVADNREFFIAPLKEVIACMIQIENSYGGTSIEDRADYAPSGATDLNKLDIGQLREMDKERRKNDPGIA
jgi:hypothetical protein